MSTESKQDTGIDTYPPTPPFVLLPSLCHRYSLLTRRGAEIRMNIGRDSKDQKHPPVASFLYSIQPATTPGLDIPAAEDP